MPPQIPHPPWPEGESAPNLDMLLDWLLICPRSWQLIALSRAQRAMADSSKCFLENHESLKRELMTAQIAAASAYQKGWDDHQAAIMAKIEERWPSNGL